MPAPRSIPGPTVLLGIVATLVLVQLLIVSGGDAPAAIWLLAPLYALYVTAVLLLCAAAMARLRGRSLLPLPLLSERWRSHPRSYLVLTALVVLLTLLREGAFAPDVVANYDVFQANHRTNTSRNASSNSATLGEGAGDVMAGRRVHCSLQCANPGPTCDAVLETIRCDDARDPNGDPEGAVSVMGTISLDEPGCFSPLHKSSQTTFGADLSANLSTGRTTTSVGVSIQGTLDQNATGPMSCYSYRRLAGTKIAADIAQALQATLDAH